MRHHALLDRKAEDGYSQRDHLLGLLKRGSDKARAEVRSQLNGPKCPPSLEYLKGYLYELHGRSGVGQCGLAPLSYQTVEAWSRLTGRSVTPREVNALLILDGILLTANMPEPEPKNNRNVEAAA